MSVRSAVLCQTARTAVSGMTAAESVRSAVLCQTARAAVSGGQRRSRGQVSCAVSDRACSSVGDDSGGIGDDSGGVGARAVPEPVRRQQSGPRASRRVSGISDRRSCFAETLLSRLLPALARRLVYISIGALRYTRCLLSRSLGDRAIQRRRVVHQIFSDKVSRLSSFQP